MLPRRLPDHVMKSWTEFNSTLRQASSPSALMASTTAVLQQRAEVTHRGSLDADP